jgi:hypothetical protein
MIFHPTLLPKVLDGSKTMTFKVHPKPHKIGSVLAVQPKRGMSGVGYIRIVAVYCHTAGEAINMWRREGFESRVAMVKFLQDQLGLRDLEHLYGWQYEFELVKGNHESY